MTSKSLRERITGQVIAAGDKGFAAINDGLIWNGRKPRNYAGLIVRAQNVQDVQEAVRYAAENGMTVSPRGGGHQFSGVAARGELIIDLGGFTNFSIDIGRQTARIEPAVTNLKMAQELARAGLAFPLGHCGSVTMSGYLLGGGIGWNSSEWGIACFSVEAFEVVLADGSLILANETEHADIFWAARGAGPGFFGIVTAYHLRLQKAPAILTAVHVYPTAMADEVAAWAERAVAKGLRNVEFTAKVAAPPPGMPVEGKVIEVIMTAFSPSDQEARAALAAIAEGAPAALHVMEAGPTPLEVLYGIIAQSMPDGLRYGVDSVWSDGSFGQVLARLVAAVSAAPSPRSFALASLRSPQAAPLGNGAFSSIGRIFAAFYGIWEEASEDQVQIAWTRGVIETLLPISVGSYIGYTDLDNPRRRLKTHSDAVAVRLAALSAQHDPDGLFAGRVRVALAA
ncbi:MAG: FAD-binding oxidoreductase [Proteobacteria bacterium]|nr:FAD-binding oxidoreductase [Pseudomonadota bacterium]